jgi:hypothetical protein
MKYDQPLLFAPNRVWRLYTGGMLLDEFTGTKDGSDGHFPEDWLASTVMAKNGEHSQAPDEGLAKVITDGKSSVSLQEILTSCGASILGSKHYSIRPFYASTWTPLCDCPSNVIPMQQQPGSFSILRSVKLNAGILSPPAGSMAKNRIFYWDLKRI